MATFGKIIKNYGSKGLLIYLKLKFGRTSNIKVPGILNTIKLRRKTSDIPLFKQIFVHNEYKFKSPIRPKFIIDAGANIGLSTIFFHSQFPEATLVAIEVEKQNYSLLCHNTRNNNNIKPINAGLWPKSATLEIIDPGLGATGFMVQETSPGNPNGFQAISIPDIMNKFKVETIDLLKIDIEGAEKELLSDNYSWIGQTKIIIIELHDRKKAGCSSAFFKAFSQFNFECHPFGQNFLLINRDLRD